MAGTRMNCESVSQSCRHLVSTNQNQTAGAFGANALSHTFFPSPLFYPSHRPARVASPALYTSMPAKHHCTALSSPSTPRCFCRGCADVNEDEWLVKHTPDQAVDCAISEYSSTLRFLVHVELQLELVHKLYRQGTYRVLRLSRRLKQDERMVQFARLRIGIATTAGA